MRFYPRILLYRPGNNKKGYLIDGLLQAVGFVPEFSSDVDVSGFGSHGKAYDKGAFD
jgi:hypothetical protein